MSDIIIVDEHLKKIGSNQLILKEKFVHKSYGYVKYDPIRPGLKKKPHWWAIVNTDFDIVKYYRYYLNRVYHMHHVVDPAWGSHISIIRGEKPKPEKMHLWNKLQAGKKIEFIYTHEVYSDDDFWWLNVYSPQLFEIREEFGMPITFGFHLTIGKNKWKDLT